MQFARDAHQAEGWLLTQEPYLKKEEEKNAVCKAMHGLNFSSLKHIVLVKLLASVLVSL